MSKERTKGLTAIFLFKIGKFFKLRLERKKEVQSQIKCLSWKDFIITFLLLGNSFAPQQHLPGRLVKEPKYIEGME